MAVGIGFGGDMAEHLDPGSFNDDRTPPRFIDPEPCCSVADGGRAGIEAGGLSASQVERWRTEGFVFVDELFDQDLIGRLAAAACDHYPRPGTDRSDRVTDFGSGGGPGGAKPLVFPSHIDAFNRLTLDHRLLATVAQLLDVAPSELRLTQADLWPKYGRADRTGTYDNQDQRIHVDYPNHMLVHPAPWDRPEAVKIIVYLSDHAHCGGGTAVVPRRGPDDPAYRWPIIDSPGIGKLAWINDRPSAEAYLAQERPELAEWRRALYDREVQTRYRRGSVLLYRHDTWHRGTPLRPGSMRLAQNLTFRRADAEWINTLHPGWSWAMYRKGQPMERLIAEASVEQRTVLGFPKPGSRYWVPETVAAVAARYGPLGMDMRPYAEGAER